MSSRSNRPGPLAGSGAPLNVEQVLSAIDGVIRGCRLPEPLYGYLTAETPVVNDAASLHHPDSMLVLTRCLERHPEATEFGDRTVKVVLLHLLHDRATMAVLARLCAEDPRVVQSVMARLTALSPDGGDEDAWWVWQQLDWQYPATLDYHYSEKQIRLAWKTARLLRWRQDHAGAGGPRCVGRRRRAALLAGWSKELSRPVKELLCIDIDDYDPCDGTLAIHSSDCELVTRLSAGSQRKAKRWLALRGYEPGGLFDLPPLAEFWETPQSHRPYCLERAGNDRASALSTADEEDTLDSLCQDEQPLVCAYVLANVSQEGGDWSPEFVERLQANCGSLAGHDFSVYERRKCRHLLGCKFGDGCAP